MEMSGRVKSGICLVTLVALASGCGASSSHGVAGAKKTIVHRCAPGAERAVARRTTTAYRAPGRGAIERFGLRNVNRVPTVFSVVAERLDTRCRPTWLR